MSNDTKKELSICCGAEKLTATCLCGKCESKYFCAKCGNECGKPFIPSKNPMEEECGACCKFPPKCKGKDCKCHQPQEEDWEKEEWEGWKIVSEMLDNPDENGIYNTSKCYKKLYSNNTLMPHELATSSSSLAPLLSSQSFSI